MAITRQIFGCPVVVAHCEQKELYADHVTVLEKLIQQPEFNGVVPEQQGAARSTVMNLKAGQIAHLPEFQPLMQWIYNTVWQHRSVFGQDKATHLNLGRNWVNEMYRGCKGILHQHFTHVCVFYVRVPDNAADMQFIQDDDTIAAGCQQGDLLIHPPLLWHSVSEHCSDTSRICLVIEFDFVA